MRTNVRHWFAGLGIGALAASMDVVLIVATDEAATPWVLVQSALFWLIAGWIVVASHSGLGDYTHGIVVTILLNLPWYVNLAIASGKTHLLPPLLVMSIAFGLLFGWARRSLSETRTPAAAQ